MSSLSIHISIWIFTQCCVVTGTVVPFAVAPDAGGRGRPPARRGGTGTGTEGTGHCGGAAASDSSRGCRGHRARCRRCREPRALAPGGDGDEASRPPCALLHRACKELQTIYMCVVSSAKGLNLYSFSAPSAPYELPNIQWKTTSVPKCVCV